MSLFKRRKEFVDYRIVKVFDKVNEKCNQELGKTFSNDIIEAVVKSQSKTVAKGMEDGDIIACKYFGSFFPSAKRIDALNNTLLAKGIKPTFGDKGLTTLNLNFKKK